MKKLDFTCVFMLCLFGCSGGDDVVKSFKKQMNLYIEIVEQLKLNPKIEKVSISLPVESIVNDKEIDADTVRTYNQIVDKMKIIDKSYIQVIRDRKNLSLQGVSFSVSSGLNDWKNLKELIYVKNKETIKSIEGDGTTCSTIENSDWYICETDNR